MALRVFLPLVIIAGIFFALFAYLTARGPFQVDCGDVDPEVCQQIWHEAAAAEEGLTSLVPVTRVRIVVTVDDPATCNEVYLERLIFSSTHVNECAAPNSRLQPASIRA
jgi:hypothetical protein